MASATTSARLSVEASTQTRELDSLRLSVQGSVATSLSIAAEVSVSTSESVVDSVSAAVSVSDSEQVSESVLTSEVDSASALSSAVSAAQASAVTSTLKRLAAEASVSTSNVLRVSASTSAAAETSAAASLADERSRSVAQTQPSAGQAADRGPATPSDPVATPDPVPAVSLPTTVAAVPVSAPGDRGPLTTSRISDLATPAGKLKSGQSSDTIDKRTIGTHLSVNAVKRIGLYRTATFSKKSRLAWYAKMPRTRQPQFVVIGTAVSKNGHLRYKVRDVNHGSKTYGLTGYITARKTYVQPTYYRTAAKSKLVTVLNPRGIDAYATARLTGKATTYRQGTVLRVKRIVHYHLTTRFQLTTGKYVTANKQWVQNGRFVQAKRIHVQRGAKVYRDVNLHQVGTRITGTTPQQVLGWNYTNNGTLLYRVAGGYIPADTVIQRTL